MRIFIHILLDLYGNAIVPVVDFTFFNSEWFFVRLRSVYVGLLSGSLFVCPT